MEDMEMDDHDDLFGIDIEHAHKRAVELVPEEFFWNCADELSPFGSDEGDIALAEFRDWRRLHPDSPVEDCLKWTIESIGEIDFKDYNESLVSPEKVKQQIADEDFDDQQYIYTLDVSVIATGFAQLVDEGRMDESAKSVIRVALDRQILWSGLHEHWEHSEQYIDNLRILKRVLQQA